MNILLISSDTILIRLVEQKLNTSKFEVTVCKDLNETENYLQTQTCDLMVVDYILPDTSGLELARFVKEDLKLNFPIVLLAEINTPQIIEQSKTIGINEFIAKPFSPHQLSLKIKKLLTINENNAL